jgi:hypothetical protein
VVICEDEVVADRVVLLPVRRLPVGAVPPVHLAVPRVEWACVYVYVCANAYV